MRRGAVTLYLCLLLAALLTLFAAAMFSARHAAGRVVLASAAEQGMYSLFSRFDRNLFDTYGILALDGGYGEETLRLGALKEEAEETITFLTGSEVSLTGPDNLMHLVPENSEVTGYILLTDQSGEYLKEQICRALVGKKTAAAVEEVRSRLNGQSSDWNSLDRESRSIDASGAEQEYRNLREQPGDSAELSSVQRIILSENEEETHPITSENPIEFILGLKNLGILQLVLPRDCSLAHGEMEADRVSERDLQQGMGVMEAADASLADRAVLLEYIMDSFEDFTEAGEAENAGLQYQVEYAIGGKDSDEENLKAVVNRLLAVREASNYLYLQTDSAKQQEIQAAAAGISALVGLPGAELIVAKMLQLSWAFGESILDIRELLEGGKIPLMKDASSWQLSLSMLTHIQEEVTEQHGSDHGLDYQWYLRLLLAEKGEEELTESIMDLLEHRIRQEEGRSGFRLDNCLVSMTVCFRAKQDGRFMLEAERNYNYKQ